MMYGQKNTPQRSLLLVNYLMVNSFLSSFDTTTEKDQSLLIVNKCPLYPGGGGQIADLGYLTLKSGGDLLQLQNIFAISETAIVLHVQHSPEINIKVTHHLCG